MTGRQLPGVCVSGGRWRVPRPAPRPCASPPARRLLSPATLPAFVRLPQGQHVVVERAVVPRCRTQAYETGDALAEQGPHGVRRVVGVTGLVTGVQQLTYAVHQVGHLEFLVTGMTAPQQRGGLQCVIVQIECAAAWVTLPFGVASGGGLPRRPRPLGRRAADPSARRHCAAPCASPPCPRERPLSRASRSWPAFNGTNRI